jgi:hypothetical protein
MLPYDISIQATGNLRSRGAITQGYRRSNQSLDLGLRKSFFNKRLSLSINWRDVFNSRKWENYTSSDTFTRHQKNWRDPRINVTVSWNFGNMNNEKRGNGGGGGDFGGGDEDMPMGFGDGGGQQQGPQQQGNQQNQQPQQNQQNQQQEQSQEQTAEGREG